MRDCDANSHKFHPQFSRQQMSLTRSLLRLRQYSVASTAETVVPEAAILAVLREGSGERSAARERKSGRVPSVVLQRQSGKNGGKNRLISVQESQIRKFVAEYGQSSFLSRLFRLHIRSEFRQEADLIADVRVLPRMAHFNPEKETPINISFIDAPSDAWLKVHIPLVYKGKDVSPGLKKGRPLKTVKKTAEFMCPADLIPPFIEVDLSELDAGQQILVGDLNVPLELSRLLPKEDVVCEIMGSALSILRKNSERLGFNSETMLLIA